MNDNERALRRELEQLTATLALFLDARRSAFDLRSALNEANTTLARLDDE
jgi:hypothetical protein